MCECEMRAMALQMALETCRQYPLADIIPLAEKFYAFLNKCDCEQIPEGEVN